MMALDWLVLSAEALPIPSPDPLGLAAPPVLLQALAYLTFTLHILAVDFTLGGVLLSLWARWRKLPGHASMTRFWRLSTPLGFSYLVTFGVPPLLFLQVIYGQFIYSSSVILGAMWIATVPMLIFAYGALYLHKLSHEARPRWQLPVLLSSAIVMLLVGFVLVNNITLSMVPERWAALYHASPGGVSSNLGEPTLFPRYLLFMSAPFVIAGMVMVMVGAVLKRWKETEKARQFSSLGWSSMVLGRFLLVLTGALLLWSLPPEIAAKVSAGGMETLFFALGLLLAMVSTGLVFQASRLARLDLSIAALVVASLEAAAFIMLRDQVRLDYLAPHFQLNELTVNAQWGLFGLFAVSLVVGLVFLILVTIRVARGLLAARAQ
ncbi:MAG: hypothetical protein RBU37_14975 [Myxococcota bacterium]|jgi:hypothetical protein|nr:hypothetical protein [Myxococcota bacterium]